MTRSFAASRRRARHIAERILEGESTKSIGKDLGISDRRVREIMKRYSVPLLNPPNVRFALGLSRRRTWIIMALAEQAGVKPSTMIARIVSTVIDDGEDVARRRLGKLALPASEEGGE